MSLHQDMLGSHPSMEVRINEFLCNFILLALDPVANKHLI